MQQESSHQAGLSRSARLEDVQNLDDLLPLTRLSPDLVSKAHDPALWIKAKAGMLPRQTLKSARIVVDATTLQAIISGCYISPSGSEVILNQDLIRDSCIETRLFALDELRMDVPQTTERAAVCFVREDCLYAAQVLKQASPSSRIAVLNLASYLHPGGGYRWGTAAQEESIMRRSTSCVCLDAPLCQTVDPTRERVLCNLQYPIGNHQSGIYSPAVQIFRKSESDGYEFLEEPFVVDCIAVAAVKNPQLDLQGRMSDQDTRLSLVKIDIIFQIAIAHGVDSLVLGALGCGAYQNPPHQIAQLFLQTVLKYRSAFKDIVFAILDHDGRLIETFSTVFKMPYLTNAAMLAKTNWRGEPFQEIAAVEPIVCSSAPTVADGACPLGYRCVEWAVSREHLLSFTHPPICPDSYRCEQFDDYEHLQSFVHPFLQPCRYGLQCARSGSHEHITEFAHRCRFGKTCKRLNEVQHLRMFLHRTLIDCDNGMKCPLLSDARHCLNYRHEGAFDVRPMCRDGADCRDSLLVHRAEYLHDSA
eukprot:TRINITY_DN407_c0_g1_i4.p2 TRINITY_DN407_c0_g1~~TRINITY_DN407_c0_g1_i4.p2  ORF type:complete len:531 (-),score=53.12 TRINITY_DN407_c0_g1_i4:7741-9333(-)